jgi:Uma2 family endonuclease
MRVDKVLKMRVYAQYEIRYLWLIDPSARTQDVFRLSSGRWTLLETYVEDDKVRAEPFQEIEIELGNFWAE